MANRKTWERYSFESLTEGTTDRHGRLFVSQLGQENLADVRLLRAGVDTIRQLYTGVCQDKVFETIKEAYDNGFRQIIELGGLEWLLGSGGASGYRYRLQNSDHGLILLFGSRYAEPDKDASHLKIEVSPHYIDQRTASDIQRSLNTIAGALIQYPQPSGVAIHLALDLQGWEPAKDFEDNFICRSKRRASFEGINSLEFENVNEISAVYGNRESFLFGSAAALQFGMYRKDIEARKRDKHHFWQKVWERSSGGELSPETAYQEGEPVWRLETRFHHSVISEFAEGIDESLNSFEQLSQHLTGLWRYALNTYRLDRTRTYIDPFWQLILEDVEFYQPDPGLWYVRARKKPGSGNEKNIALATGNLLSIYARNGFKTKVAMKCLRSSGMWKDLVNYFYDRQMGLSEITQWVEQGLAVRRLQGKAA